MGLSGSIEVTLVVREQRDDSYLIHEEEWSL